MIFGISKSTIEGLLAALLALAGPATALLIALQAINPHPNYTLSIIGIVLTFLFAVLRAWAGLIQNDATAPVSSTANKSSIPPVVGLLLLFALIPVLMGCKTQQPPPAWAATAPALTLPGELIAGANFAVVGYEKDAAAGVAYTKDAALKAVISDIQKALVVAQPAFNTWEAAAKTNPSALEPADLSAALLTIQADIGKLPAQLQK
jgi:hypothetical protein